jgi:hypothetical protein
MRDALDEVVRDGVSGRELTQWGCGAEIAWALDIDASTTVPLLQSDGFISSAGVR